MKAAAKEGDHVLAVDTHLCSGAPTPVPFDGLLDDELSPDVLAEHKHVAVVGSKATNTSPHVAPTGSFDVPPHDRATVMVGSGTLIANHEAMARHDDAAETSNDPKDDAGGQGSSRRAPCWSGAERNRNGAVNGRRAREKLLVAE